MSAGVCRAFKSAVAAPIQSTTFRITPSPTFVQLFEIAQLQLFRRPPITRLILLFSSLNSLIPLFLAHAWPINFSLFAQSTRPICKIYSRQLKM